MTLASALRASSRTPLLQVLKTSLAAAVAWAFSALLLQQPLPIFAAIAALLVVQPSINQSLAKGIERSAGVTLGVVLAYTVGVVFGTSPVIVLLAIVASLLVAWALRLSPGSANQVPISAMLVLALGAQSPGYAVDRIVETVIGAAAGLAVNAAIVPPVLLQPAHLAVGRLLTETAAAMERLAGALREPQDRARLDALLDRARTLRGLREKAAAAVTRGEESLTLNPRRNRHRRVLERDVQLLGRLTALVTRVIGMTRAVHDRYDPRLADDPQVAAIAVELERAAHDLRLLNRVDRDADQPAEPALTAPVRIAGPDPEHWVLVGSLLEDLRRVREEIIGGADAG